MSGGDWLCCKRGRCGGRAEGARIVARELWRALRYWIIGR